MKSFFRRKDETSPYQSNKQYCIALSERDYALIDENDAPLKFRLNEALERMIDEICTFLDISASDFIRQALFIHLYGRYDLLGLLERQFPALQEGREVIVSGPPECSSSRAANVADFKVWLPRVMKDDLLSLAEREGETLSRYVREVVTTHLTGHPALARQSPLNHPFNPPPASRKPKK
jgi:hypothetical protein